MTNLQFQTTCAPTIISVGTGGFNYLMICADQFAPHVVCEKIVSADDGHRRHPVFGNRADLSQQGDAFEVGKVQIEEDQIGAPTLSRRNTMHGDEQEQCWKRAREGNPWTWAMNSCIAA